MENKDIERGTFVSQGVGPFVIVRKDSGQKCQIFPGDTLPSHLDGYQGQWVDTDTLRPREIMERVPAGPKECVFRSSAECMESASAIVSSAPHAHTVEVCASHIWWGLTVIGAPGMTMTVRLI